jgi:hypothetical protein
MRSETESPQVAGTENYYDDFINVQLTVPCCTWNEQEAVKCWGEDFASKFARGIVSKVSLNRKTKEPKFEIKFPEKKYQNTFVGYDMDYVLSYSDELPLKYHALKADHIKKTARKAEMDMKQKAKDDGASNNMPVDDEDVLVLDMLKKGKSSEHASLKDDEGADSKKTGEVIGKPPSSQNKRKSSATAIVLSSQKQGEKSKATPSFRSPESDIGSSGEESEVDEDEEEEAFPDLLDDDTSDDEDADIASFEPFDPKLWKLNQLPDKNDVKFGGISGSQHTLSVATALPFEYFCLFIPIFFWDRWAQYTNDKAEK